METCSGRRLLGKIIPCTKSWITILANETQRNNRTHSCAGWLHLHVNFTERRSNNLRKTLDTSTCAKVLSRVIGNHSSSTRSSIVNTRRAPQVALGNWREALRCKMRTRGNNGDTTDNECSSSIWKRMRDTAVLVEQKPNFKVHLRVEGVPEDVILKDEEQMKQINETVEKLKDGYDIFWRVKSRDLRWVTSKCSNCDKFRWPFSVILAWSTCQKDLNSVHVEFVLDQMKTQ